MSGYRDLEVYKLAFELCIKVHRRSLKLPAFELYEQGSQIRRSSKSIKDTISEGYGRKRYKAEFVKFLTYSIGSCDETLNHLDTIIELYPDLDGFSDLRPDYDKLGRMLNNYIQYVEEHWKT